MPVHQNNLLRGPPIILCNNPDNHALMEACQMIGSVFFSKLYLILKKFVPCLELYRNIDGQIISVTNGVTGKILPPLYIFKNS